MVRKLKQVSRIKTIQVKISLGMKKDLDKIISEYKGMGIGLSYGEASELYRRSRK